MSWFGRQIVQRRFADIGSWLLAGKTAEVPEVLRGVYFMDGNPAPEDCMSFEGLPWDAQRRRVTVPLYGILHWTFQDSSDGRWALWIARLIRLTVIVTFTDDTLTRASVGVTGFGLPLPAFIRRLELVRAEGDTTGDTWFRRTYSGDELALEYTLRRVVNTDGSPTPGMASMLEALPETCITISRRT